MGEYSVLLKLDTFDNFTTLAHIPTRVGHGHIFADAHRMHTNAQQILAHFLTIFGPQNDNFWQVCVVNVDEIFIRIRIFLNMRIIRIYRIFPQLHCHP